MVDGLAVGNKIKWGISFLGLLAFCLLAGRQACAAVNYKGVDGLINIPSAYVQMPWKASLGYFNRRDGAAVSGNLSLSGGMELSCSYWMPETGKDTGSYSIKGALMKEKVLAPAVAVGVADLTDAVGRSYYLVASKCAPWGMRLHVGARSGRQAKGFFGGLEKQIKLKNNLREQPRFIPLLAVVLEHDGRDFNYGVYARNSHGMRVDLGWHDDRFMAGVQMEF